MFFARPVLTQLVMWGDVSLFHRLNPSSLCGNKNQTLKKLPINLTLLSERLIFLCLWCNFSVQWIEIFISYIDFNKSLVCQFFSFYWLIIISFFYKYVISYQHFHIYYDLTKSNNLKFFFFEEWHILDKNI